MTHPEVWVWVCVAEFLLYTISNATNFHHLPNVEHADFFEWYFE